MLNNGKRKTAEIINDKEKKAKMLESLIKLKKSLEVN